jgi:MerR family transcriptional regulator, light-induced transcriptional regulator
MSEDLSYFSGRFPPPLRRAQEAMEQRGLALPASALRVLAREVILRVSRAEPLLVPAMLRPSTSEIDALCDALMSQDETAASEMVRASRLGGMTADVLYHVYIAEAVRRLGVRWERDEATSAEVVLGAGRVYAILRDLRAVFLAEQLTAPPGAEAVFAAVPGEVHGLGATMAADALRRKGWDITLILGLGHGSLVEEIARLRPAMVGISIAQSSMTFAVARLIVALRVRCPQVWVLVGGPVIADDPDVTRIVDADAGAATIDDGIALMNAHLAELNRLHSDRA